MIPSRSERSVRGLSTWRCVESLLKNYYMVGFITSRLDSVLLVSWGWGHHWMAVSAGWWQKESFIGNDLIEAKWHLDNIDYPCYDPCIVEWDKRVIQRSFVYRSTTFITGLGLSLANCITCLCLILICFLIRSLCLYLTPTVLR